MSLCAPHLCRAHGDSERALDPLERELQVFESHYLDAGNLREVL